MKFYKVLWTGGWDSTFRVLDLIINKREKVKPYYILDKGRKSTDMELRTMDIIRDMIKVMGKELSDNLANVEIINMQDIPENDDITKSYKTLARQSHLGSQYDWLARYCKHENINVLELCIHQDDTVEGFIKNDVDLIKKDGDRYYKLKNNPSQKELDIFSYYHYPLFDMTKIDMERKSKDSGFDHIMEVTWFCHSPLNGKPCGMCNPCKYTRDEGLGRRVPNPTLIMKTQRRLEQKIRGFKKRMNIS